MRDLEENTPSPQLSTLSGDWQAMWLEGLLERCFPHGSDLTPDERDAVLPMVSFVESEEARLYTFVTLSLYRPDIPRFLYDITQKWNIFGGKICIESVICKKFQFFELEEESYLASEIAFTLMGDLSDAVRESLQELEKEISLGLRSIYHARKLLEMKAITANEKTTLIQEKITELVHRFPATFDYDIFDLMQKYLVNTTTVFRSLRCYKHMLRLICIAYLYWQKLLANREKRGRHREILLKIAPEVVETPFGTKEVLNFIVGVNFIKENERFGKAHLLKAVRRFVPGANLIEESYFSEGSEESGYHVFSIEIEKEGAKAFTDEEVSRLQLELEPHLKECIETLVRPIFMPRNEEEVMKYLLVLAGQVTEENDIAQVALLFDEQTERDLFFTVALVRPLSSEAKALEELLYKQDKKIDVTIEKVKRLGYVKRQVAKEASILRVRLPNTPFLRDDYAVDLYRARQRLVQKLEEIFGEVRDYNGGMIAKQMDVLSSLRELLQVEGISRVLGVESFFHSLYPVELRSVFPPEKLRDFFLFLQELHFDENICIKKGPEELMVAVLISDTKKREMLLKDIAQMKATGNRMLQIRWQVGENPILAFFYQAEDVALQELFLNRLQEQLS